MENKKKKSPKTELADLIKKHITTTMIGSLSRFEDYFGRFWGHQQENELTENQKKIRKLWEEARNEILDLGNDKIKDSWKDLRKFVIYYSDNKEGEGNEY